MSTLFEKVFLLMTNKIAVVAVKVKLGGRREVSQMVSSPIYTNFIISNGLWCVYSFKRRKKIYLFVSIYCVWIYNLCVSTGPGIQVFTELHKQAVEV